MALTLRRAIPADAAACGVVDYEAFKTLAEQHGFPPDFPSPEIATGVGALLGYTVRAASAADGAPCNRLCRQVHGHDRAGELADAIRQGTARVVERHGRITGYTTQVAFFGHAIAETTDDLKALVMASPD